MKEKTIALVTKLLKSELISGSFYLFLGTTIANILAFVFNLFLVRHVSYAEYAEFSALISLVTLVAIPSQAFIPTIVQFAGRYFAKGEIEKASELFWQATRKIGIVAAVIFSSFVIFSPVVGNFLHIRNFFEIGLAGGVIAVMYISITNTAFLQSLLRFRFLSMTISLSGILKVLCGIGFLLAGLGIIGVLSGYFLSFLLPLLITYIPLYFLITTKHKKKIVIHNKEILAYGLPATIAIFSLSSFTSTDILLVKHFFPNDTAALYSGLSLVGRIIFYFTAPISAVMFPLVIKRIHQGEKSQNLLYVSFLMVLIPSIGLTLFYFLFPHIAISLFLGKHYFSIAPYLGWFGLYLTLFSLLNVLVNFFLSMKQTNVSWFVGIGAVLQILGIFIFHTNIGVIIGISLILSLVLFVILLLYYMRLYGNTQKTT